MFKSDAAFYASVTQESCSNPAASCTSGRLDSATRQLMSMPRCGRPDIERADDDDDPNDFGLAGNIGGLGRRKKRYVAGKSYVRPSNLFI